MDESEDSIQKSSSDVIKRSDAEQSYTSVSVRKYNESSEPTYKDSPVEENENEQESLESLPNIDASKVN